MALAALGAAALRVGSTALRAGTSSSMSRSRSRSRAESSSSTAGFGTTAIFRAPAAFIARGAFIAPAGLPVMALFLGADAFFGIAILLESASDRIETAGQDAREDT